MKIITLDFESYWSSTYTLSQLSPLQYVMGAEYETISCAIKVGNEPTWVCWGHDEIADAFSRLDIANSALLAHNMLGFDSYICAYRFGLKPKVWLDTAAMARPLHAKTCGVSLKKLVEHYGLGVKQDAILMATKGKRLADFTQYEREQMAIYNVADTEQCYALFQKLKGQTNANELWQIDLNTRMRVEPAFEVDVGLLQVSLETERANKRAAILELAEMLDVRVATLAAFELDNQTTEDELAESVRATLASAQKFSELLVKRGVEVPMKPSIADATKMIPALAKSDQAFQAMMEHEDEVVAAAARARLAIKSTLLETRIGHFLTASELAGGKLPMPIRYAGADTTGRDSGEEYNPLNMPRVGKKPKTSDCLRNSLCAPKGKKVIVCDQSNIELRVNHTLWRVGRSMDLWKGDPNADLYRVSAALRYGVSVEEIGSDDPRRQQAKVEELGLGFGAGADTFRQVARIMSGGAIDLSKKFKPHPDGTLVLVSDPALESVQSWRERYPEIKAGWGTCNEALSYIHAGVSRYIDPWQLARTSSEGIVLPGYTIRYPNLREESDPDNPRRKQWVYGDGRHKARIYGPKVVENIVQSLARHTICDNTIEFFKRTGLRPALRPYDELVYVVDEAVAEELLAELLAVMRTPPRWWPELTVWAAGKIGTTYGNSK
jgi:DNA polymerase